MTAPTLAAPAVTRAQLDHLRAAAAGQLHVADNGNPYGIRRTTRHGGRKANHAVTERLRESGLIVAVLLPGCSSKHRYDPTAAGRAVLDAAGVGQ